MSHHSSRACISIAHDNNIECQMTGFYCPIQPTFNYTEQSLLYVPNPAGTLSLVVQTSQVHCNQQPLVTLCPSGYYCPTSSVQYLCPYGYYCGIGFAQPRLCVWNALGCPTNGMNGPSASILFFSFSMILFLALYLYHFLQLKDYSSRENRSRDYSKVLDTLEKEYEANHQKFLNLNELRHRSTSSGGIGGISGRKVTLQDIVEKEVSFPNRIIAATINNTIRKNGNRLNQLLGYRDISNKTKNIKNNLQAFEFRSIENPLTISFDHLTLTLPVSNQILLNNVFGSINSFEITCILGPSGAGKTTLLNLLRGHAHYANWTGKITINGKPIPSLDILATQMAFVPQEDIVYEELTVEDNIMYSAMLFNKRGLIKSADLLPMVYKAEQMLGIEHIRYSIVGGAAKKGISGGQRKRVSIAMEIVKESSLLVLDEPTSGLDSATSISVLHTLHELADLGVNIVTTLHQPRFEILELIHSLILLAPGGRIAYLGSPTNLRDHFLRFGYECPLNMNIADFVMDCLAGFVVPHNKSLAEIKEGKESEDNDSPIKSEGEGEGERVRDGRSLSPTKRKKSLKPVQEIVNELCDYWETTEHPSHEKEMEEQHQQYLKDRVEGEDDRIDNLLRDNHSILKNGGNNQSAQNDYSFFEKVTGADNGKWQQETKKSMTQFFHVAYVAGSRQKKLYNQTFAIIVSTCLVLLAAGIAVGYLENAVRLESINSTPNIISQTTFSQLVFGIFVSNAALNLFVHDELNRQREEEGGIHLFPFFIGKLTASYIEFCFYSFAFLCGYYSVINSNAHFLNYLSIFFFLHLSLSGMSNLIAILAPRGMKNLNNLGLLVVFWLFGGIQPTTRELPHVFPVIGPILNAFSPFRWSFALQMTEELFHYSQAFDALIAETFTQYGYSFNRIVLYRWMLIFYWWMFNFLAFIALLLRRNDWLLWNQIIASMKEWITRLIDTYLNSSLPSDSKMPIRDNNIRLSYKKHKKSTADYATIEATRNPIHEEP